MLDLMFDLCTDEHLYLYTANDFLDHKNKFLMFKN